MGRLEMDDHPITMNLAASVAKLILFSFQNARECEVWPRRAS
jgi:hypothetical protein